jgi:hypothetical protein
MHTHVYYNKEHISRFEDLQDQLIYHHFHNKKIQQIAFLLCPFHFFSLNVQCLEISFHFIISS